jgi:hypothetical protein
LCANEEWLNGKFWIWNRYRFTSYQAVSQSYDCWIHIETGVFLLCLGYL